MRRLYLAGLVLLSIVLDAPARAQTAVSEEARGAIVANAAKLMRDRYVFPDIGEQAAAKIESGQAGGAYASLDLLALSDRLTADLQAVTHDKHIRVRTPGALPPKTPPGGRSERSDGGVVRADLLPGNIGYIEVDGFPPREMMRPALDRSFAALADTRALIIDVRRNGGGRPSAVAYLVSFFLDNTKPPIVLNDFHSRKPGTREFTQQPSYSVAAPVSYLGKPVYVLTSNYTFSGGEEFAYDMQAFKLGMLVGETTGGGANPGGMSPIGSTLSLFVPGGRPINPVTGTNWEGVGVIPDTPTGAEDALKVALEKLGETPTSKDIASLSVQQVLAPRTTQTPGGADAIRTLTGQIASGTPDYTIMSPEMADITRAQLSNWTSQLAALGDLKSIRFVEVDYLGADAYDVDYANGSLSWLLLLGPNGQIAMAQFFRPDTATPTEEARMAAFKTNDLDGDGRIDKAGYKALLDSLGFGDQLDQLFAQRDVNKDGFISTEEYRTPIPQ